MRIILIISNYHVESSEEVQFQDAKMSRAGKLQALECHCNEQPRQTPQLAKGSQDLMDLLNGKNWDMMI